MKLYENKPVYKLYIAYNNASKLHMVELVLLAK